MALAGTLFGFGSALWLGPVNRQVQVAPHWVRVESGDPRSSASANAVVQPLPLKPVTDSASSADTAASAEVERLKTRNRRLEALVAVLKQRSHDKDHLSPNGLK